MYSYQIIKDFNLLCIFIYGINLSCNIHMDIYIYIYIYIYISKYLNNIVNYIIVICINFTCN